MNKVEYITEQINNIKVSGKFAEEAKQKLIEFYCVTNKSRLKDISEDVIKAQDFKREIKTGAMRLKKLKEIKKIVTKFERHTCAPELNYLQFKSGKTYKVHSFVTTMEDALIYASFHMDEREIEFYKN